MGNFLRNYATPLTLVAFAAVGVSGVMMLAGLRSHALGEVHEKLGLFFVAAALLHLIKNGRGVSMIFRQNRNLVLVGLLGAVAILLIGTALMSGGGFGGGPGGRHDGRGPHGGPTSQLEQRMAYPPINTLAPALGLSPGQVIARLRSGGVAVVGPGQNLADIAQRQGTDVDRLVVLIVTDPQTHP